MKDLPESPNRVGAPNFDSPSVFAAILDDEKGGSFSLAAEGDPAVKQMYLPNTNVLITRFLHDAGMGEVSDFMSVGREAGGETEQSSRQLVRIAKSIRAPIPFRMVCSPAFDYARQPHEIEMGPDGRSALSQVSNQQFVLKSTHPLRREQNAVIAEFTVEGAEQAVFALRLCDGRADRVMMEEPLDGEALLNETVRFWRAWRERPAPPDLLWAGFGRRFHGATCESGMMTTAVSC